MSDETIGERLERVNARIVAACARTGRGPASVRLLAVSKTQPPERVCAAAAAGLICFGENKVQEAAAKIPECPGHLEWHLVGHLQGNKVRPAVKLFRMIHSIDSLALLQRANELAGEEGANLRVCLEVNVSGEGSKFGMKPGDVAPTLDAARTLARVDVVGLMTMPPFAEDPERGRGFFRRLRELRDESRARTGFDLPDLSMGMSHDFEIAIEEGATWIRVGTDLFGERVRKQTEEV